jgi:predicted anti-sigma-YlaC factor YlaD
MDCRTAQDAILESFDHVGRSEGLPAIESHLAGCAACAAFAARQEALDGRLGQALAPPELSAGFRNALRKRIRREAMHVWADSLPDKVHFASCGLATVLCAVLLPFQATTVLSAGTAATIVTYLMLMTVRTLFEDAGDQSL